MLFTIYWHYLLEMKQGIKKKLLKEISNHWGLNSKTPAIGIKTMLVTHMKYKNQHKDKMYKTARVALREDSEKPLFGQNLNCSDEKSWDLRIQPEQTMKSKALLVNKKSSYFRVLQVLTEVTDLHQMMSTMKFI